MGLYIVLIVISLCGCGISQTNHGSTSDGGNTSSMTTGSTDVTIEVNKNSEEGNVMTTKGISKDGTFSNAQGIVSGYLQCYTRDNFEEDRDFDLTDKDIESIKNALENAKVMDENYEIGDTYKYYLYLYDDTESEIYFLIMDDAGHVLLQDGSLVDGQDLYNWFNSIEGK